MRYISRSGYECYTSCERRYYYGYLYQGTGVATPTPDENLCIGLALHKAMEAFFKDCDEEACVSQLTDEWNQATADAAKVAVESQDAKLLALLPEWRALAEGMFRGWVRSQSSKFLATFEPIEVEEENQVPLADGLILQTRSDLVVRSRITGNLYVINWKTTGSKSGFFESYNRNIQMWTEALAVEQKYQEPTSVLPIGFYKGTKKQGSYSSPLIWGYEKNGVWQAKYPGWNTGFRKVAMWRKEEYELPMGTSGLKEWIDWLPIELLEEQYIETPPIQKDEKVVRDWIRQVVQRERDLMHMLEPSVPEADRELYFFQRFGKHCNWCPFDSICQQLATTSQMVEEGLLIPRVDHHTVGGDGE